MSDQKGSAVFQKYLPTVTVLLIPLVQLGEPPWIMAIFFILVSIQAATVMSKGGPVTGFLPPGLRIPLAAGLMLIIFHLATSANPYYSFQAAARVFMALVFFSHISPAGTFYRRLILGAWMAAESGVVIYQLLAGTGQLTGTFGSPNLLATFFLVIAAFCIGVILSRYPEKLTGEIYLAGAGAIVTSWLVLTIGSRSALLALALMLLVTAVFAAPRRKILAIALLLIIVLLPNLGRQRLIGAPEADPYALSRLEIWRMGVAMGQDHPFTGAGTDLFGDLAPRYAIPVRSVPARYGRMARKPHSDYMKAWSEGGSVGLLTVLALLAMITMKVPSAWRAGRSGPVLAAGAICFQSLFHDQANHYGIVLLFFWCLAMVMTDPAKRPATDDQSRTHRAGKMLLFAIAVLITGLTLADNTARTVWNRGRDQAAAARGDVAGLSAAGDQLMRAAVLNPLHPDMARDAGKVAGMLYGANGSAAFYQVADEQLSRAARLNRTDGGALGELAALYFQLATRNPAARKEALEAAGQALESALAREPKNVFMLLQLAHLAEEQGEPEKALMLVEETLLLEPNFMGAHQARIRLLSGTNAGLADGARAAFELSRQRVKGHVPENIYEQQLFSDPG
jgi:O-antigen ligase